jgi:SHS2 domain-containing protein
MPYRFIEGLTVADVAFEATGATLEALFTSAGLAMTATEVGNPESVRKEERRAFDLTSKAVDLLLYNFLQELIYFKDVDQLLFGGFDLSIQKETEGRYRLQGSGQGEPIDPGRHLMLVEVKAVTMHRFEVTPGPDGWKAIVVLDI